MMTIAEQIKTHRKLVGMTQEQVAAALNVSTPAVNKWERGVSLPDISLLPALARLLKIDLNTLFSFQETLSEHEIGLFSNELYERSVTEGLAAAFQIAEEKIREFPRCDLLIYTTATMLGGVLTLASDLSAEEKARYEERIEGWYEQVAAADDDKLRYVARYMQAHCALQKGDVARAETLAGEIPALPIDKTSLEVEILHKKGDTAAASDKIAAKILSDSISLQNYGYKLIELDAKAGDHEGADAIATLCSETAATLGLWPYLSAVPPLLAALYRKDETASIHALQNIFASLAQPWQPSSSPIFRHLLRIKDMDGMDTSFLPALISEMQTSTEYDFLRANADFQALLAKYRA